MDNMKEQLFNQKMCKPNEINPINHPICFVAPDRLQTSSLQTSAWTEHGPFGMFLVDILHPEILVELGTHTGFSYCCFCQAVRQLGLSTRCFAIDTWVGDNQAGHYGPDILTELREYHELLYGKFSCLMQSTFDEAVNYFSDGSIDLLHIDGCHTYEAAKHDFETWLPKLSRRGIVLLHDTNVRERNFGIWKLWAELIQKYPGFEFYHGYGLGVLCVGSDSHPVLEGLKSISESQVQGWRRFFSTLGFNLIREIQIIEKDQIAEKLQRQSAELDQAQRALSRCETELSQRALEFEQVQGKLFRRDLELGDAQKTVARYETELLEAQHTVQIIRRKAGSICRELELSRNRRVVRWLDRFFNTCDLRNDISPAFQQLKDDSLIFTKNLIGYRLQSSINLERVPFLQYPLDLDRPNLKGILLAPVLDLPLTQGLLAIEIISPENTIVTQSFIPAVRINDCDPTCFEFSPISNTDQGRFWLRVFVREIDGPLRIFEWRKYPIFGLGPLRTRAFCGFQFEIGQ